MNKLYCLSDELLNLFTDLLLKSILHFNFKLFEKRSDNPISVWIGLWSHIWKSDLFTVHTIDFLVINGESNRKVIENYFLLLGSVYYNYLLLEDFDYLLLITGYYFESRSITYYFSITYYLLPHVYYTPELITASTSYFDSYTTKEVQTITLSFKST